MRCCSGIRFLAELPSRACIDESLLEGFFDYFFFLLFLLFEAYYFREVRS